MLNTRHLLENSTSSVVTSEQLSLVKTAAYKATAPGMRILKSEDVTDLQKLYHVSGQQLSSVDPKFNTKKYYGYEYGKPVIFAGDKPSSAFAGTPTKEYAALKEQLKDSIYHRLFDPKTGRKLLLGHNSGGFVHELSPQGFKRVTREDMELGKPEVSTEYIHDKPVKPTNTYPIKNTDVDAIPEYEYLGEQHVGEMPVDEYLKHAKNPQVRNAIMQWMNKKANVVAHIAGYMRDRDTRSLKDLPYDVKVNKEDINKLQGMGYKKLAPTQIMQFLDKQALQTERRQRPEIYQGSRQPTAVVVQGNPDYIKGNESAKVFYNSIMSYLRKKGYAVTSDKGKPETQPPGANIWVAHGGYNPPKGTSVLNIPQYPKPFVTKALIRALDNVIEKSKTGKGRALSGSKTS